MCTLPNLIMKKTLMLFVMQFCATTLLTRYENNFWNVQMKCNHSCVPTQYAWSLLVSLLRYLLYLFLLHINMYSISEDTYQLLLPSAFFYMVEEPFVLFTFRLLTYLRCYHFEGCKWWWHVLVERTRCELLAYICSYWTQRKGSSTDIRRRS